MPNQSGTVTSAQGVLTIGASPLDTITFTPTSATYTVEYPLGTVAIAAGTTAQTLTLTNGGQLRLLCVSGSVAYALTDNPDAYTLSQSQTAAVQALVSGDRTSVVASRDITADDNGKLLAPTGTMTLTMPVGLLPMPSFTVDCPPSATVSIARSGAATINGAGTTLTRTRASNPVGFVVLAHESDAYGVSGA